MPNRHCRFPCLITLAAICLVSPGCLSPGASQLIGTWELQSPDEVGGDPIDPPSPDTSKKIADNTNDLYEGVAEGDIAGKMSLIFRRNGSLETITDFPAAQSHKFWRWSMVSWDGQTRVARVRCQMGNETVETAITFVGQNTIQLVPPNIDVLRTELRFVRQ